MAVFLYLALLYFIFLHTNQFHNIDLVIEIRIIGYSFKRLVPTVVGRFFLPLLIIYEIDSLTKTFFKILLFIFIYEERGSCYTLLHELFKHLPVFTWSYSF